ncbi:hypothetical protein [Georgenia faecalis]|uniref:hypothetical protein n=1 Tax=Georgenia faecalis TaxID=2483799 RepID=UPI000FD6F782|nr:hypothetical protein [Georgenia faecalis]
MLEGIPLNLAELGSTAVLVIVFLMILTGRLVPRKVLEDVRADRDARLREAAGWQTAALNEQRAHGETRKQVTKLLVAGDLASKVMGSLPLPSSSEEESP